MQPPVVGVLASATDPVNVGVVGGATGMLLALFTLLLKTLTAAGATADKRYVAEISRLHKELDEAKAESAAWRDRYLRSLEGRAGDHAPLMEGGAGPMPAPPPEDRPVRRTRRKATS